MKWDVFISHASEDKIDVAMPLASSLQELGLKVWIDAQNISLGASIRESIDQAIANSAYAVVILSPAFFEKQWTNNELSALFSIDQNRNRILPIWHNVSASDIASRYPLMTDRLGVSSGAGLDHISERIVSAVNEHRLVDEYRELAQKRDRIQRRLDSISANCLGRHEALKEALRLGKISDDEYNFETYSIDDDEAMATMGQGASLPNIVERISEISKLLPPSILQTEQDADDQLPARAESKAE